MPESERRVSYQPTEGLCYDPLEEKYWDRTGLFREIERVFEVCHGCRLCFKFCDTFPALFSLIDKEKQGKVTAITPAETERILDTCFQCKLCEVNCPYTPRDGHEYRLDFPKLVHRFRALRARERGIPLRDRILGNPDLTARVARASLGMANAANRIRTHRWFLEKILGVHRAKLLPEFVRRTFEAWAEETGRVARGTGCEVVLFQTCFVQHNDPEIGRDTVEVLERNAVDVKCVRGLECCGMPAWEKGDLKSLQAHASRNLEILLPFVEKGARVAVINPTCSMMMRREYPQLVSARDRQAAVKLAAAVVDPCEYLWSIRDEARFRADFRSTPGETVAYHAPCHLRTQGIGFRGRDLLRKIPGVRPAMVQECCGHNGTYAMTVEGFEPSRRIGGRAFEGMKETGAAVWSTECPLAALQFQQHAGVKPLHPMSILARAYREDGFPHKIPRQDGER